ncbi:MAG: phosphatidylglycerophosphatase A [Bacteriovoracaceae bacterium]|nr:phosphatidylglycerophosphatase A [Bacteriovoracaceae bacterium]
MQKNSLKDYILLAFLSFLGAGFFPFASGTFASLLTLPLLFLWDFYQLPLFLFIFLLIILTLLACVTTGPFQEKRKAHDPSWIVIDEVLGMSLCWLFFPTRDIFSLLIAFVLFRFFDIVKVWPANWFDQKMKHGASVILDDIVSGIYAGFIYRLAKIYLL